jgi:hypothetical protein
MFPIIAPKIWLLTTRAFCGILTFSPVRWSPSKDLVPAVDAPSRKGTLVCILDIEGRAHPTISTPPVAAFRISISTANLELSSERTRVASESVVAERL